MTIEDAYKDNEKLLDDKGIWIAVWEQDKLPKYENKIMIGFLQDSKVPIIGLMTKRFINHLAIPGYACSHFRALAEDEIDKYCKVDCE